MTNCDVSLSYLENPIDQNEQVNISSGTGLSIGLSPIRKGNPYFEATGHVGSRSFAIGYKIGNNQLLLHPQGDMNFRGYDSSLQFTGETLNNTLRFFPLKYSFPVNETVGLGLCIENKTLVIVKGNMFETIKINFPDNSKITPVVRETQSNNVWDVVSVNFGTKYPFEYYFPGYSPFCLAESMYLPSCRRFSTISFSIALIAVQIVL